MPSMRLRLWYFSHANTIGASVAALEGIFLWREVKRAERYEQLYEEERRKHMETEQKCKDCPHRTP